MTLPSNSEADPAAARVLELFGPSSGGKSSLATRLVAGEGGPGFTHAEDRLLARVGLGWVRGRLPRILVLHAVAALGVLVTWREGQAFYRFAAAQALNGRWPGGRLLRLSLLRNAWKAAAIRLLAPRLAQPGERLLMDEGPLQTANYLLVHESVAPDAAALDAFLRVVPLPDAAAYVRAGEAELVERTLARTHPRVPAGSRAASARFVAHALVVFERIAAEPRIEARLVAPEALLSAVPASCEACA
jgi:hypothetical protein